MPAPAARRPLRLPVPTLVITGALNSGKTSLILHLLSRKPQGEVWAVLVNEMGAVGVDQAVVAAAGGAVVKELAGGCLCCAMSTVTAAALVQLVRAARPDRLIIEPSGLAHPAALLALLRGPNLGSALAVQPVICLVDLVRFSGGMAGPEVSPKGGGAGGAEAAALHADQLAAAEVLLGTKADACGAAALEAFWGWAAALQPARRVLTCSHSQIEPEALGMAPLDADAAGGGGGAAGAAAPLEPRVKRPPAREEQPAPGMPVRLEGGSPSGPVVTCGWLFHSGDVFQRERVLDWVAAAAPHALRIKGIVRLSATGESVSVSAGQPVGGAPPAVTCQPVAHGGHAGDSRIEVICRADGAAAPDGDASSVQTGQAAALLRCDWAAVERQLVALLDAP
jgi:G3E family GTPase